MKHFNKILLILIAFTAISFSSCTKDKNALVGTWVLVDKKIEFTPANPLLSMFASGYIDNVVSLPDPLILNADGTGSGVTSYLTMQFDYTKTKDQITFKNMAVYFGGNYGDDLIADYQLLDKNKTLKMTIDVTVIGLQMLQNIIDLPIDIGNISKINIVVTYTKEMSK